MNKRSGSFHIALLTCILILGVSCKSGKKVVKPLKNRSAGHIVKQHEDQMLEYTWAGMKISAEMKEEGGEEESFSANVKMLQDSAIWISISPALGVEVFRILASPDTVKILSKIPKNKFYAIEPMELFSEITGAPISFQDIQGVLMGQGMYFDTDEDKYRSTIDEQQYVLISKYNRKVKKVVGEDDRNLAPDDTLSLMDDKKAERILKKTEEEELMIKRYWFNGDNFHLEKVQVDDLFNQRQFTVEYSDFKEVETQSYPSRIRFLFEEPEKVLDIELKINRIRLNKPYDLPFEIPESIEQKVFK